MALSYNYITSATTTQVKSGVGYFHKIVFNKPIASSTVKIIDNTAGTTANIATITNTTDVKPYELIYDVRFSTGLRIVTDSADDITIVYQ